MTSQQPLLNPPARGWRRALPGPDDVPEAAPGLFLKAPNHVDDVYLELPRHYLDMRGLVCWLSLGNIFLTLWLMSSAFPIGDDLSGSLMAIGTALISVWGVSIGLKLDASPPRDLPLRFNRLRRKIYAYEFEPIWWNPFTRWSVRAVSYDWDNVRAEAWSQGGATGGGVYYSKSGVVLSVVKPGTNVVIDRFQLRAKANDEGAWAYICTYMQKGPQALPPSKWKPRDWNNEPTVNPALIFAPKVKWPQVMDVESRTAPSEQQARVLE